MIYYSKHQSVKINFLLLLFISLLSFGQKQGNNWYFGDHAGLNFNGGSPTFLANGQTSLVGCPGCHAECSTSISDSSGALLFYSNGQVVWNKNHQVMSNGDSLKSHASSTQGALLVPQPGSSRYFYLFTVDDFAYDQLKHGFRYSIIDLCLDNGNGGIINGQKNILLLDTVAEKLAAVRHANGTDYWVVVHKYYSDAFYSYHLTASGITNTVITHIGSPHPSGNQTAGGSVGQMKISPNGQKIAVVNSNSNMCIAEYFDFNTLTGVISNSVNIQWNPINGFYGAAFSSDNSKLYIGSFLNANGLYQFDLNAGGGNPTSVNASRIQITSTSQYGMQLGPDGKIYLATPPTNSNTALSVINNPNNAGLACNYVMNGISLNSAKASYSPPNFITAYSYSNTKFLCSTMGIDEGEFSKNSSILPNPNRGVFEIQIKKKTNEGLFILMNALGEKILEKTVTEGRNEIRTEGLPTGLYNYILTENHVISECGKIIIE